MQIYICKICREPIWNFICPDCLAKGITKWLPSNFSKLFLKFHKLFSNHFKSSSDEFRPCLSCRSTDSASVCLDCYMNEVHDWFNGKDSGILSEIDNKIFHFNFKKHEAIMKNHMFQPITEHENEEKELGICDDCGEYSEELMLINGRWVCQECTQPID